MAGISNYEPSLRERLNQWIQERLMAAGIDRYQALQMASGVTGGGQKPIGLLDLTNAMSLVDARDAAAQAGQNFGAGDYGLGAMNAGLGLLALGGIAGVKGSRAAKNTGKGSVAAIDFKAMLPLERQAAALRDIHLKQMPDGKFVGSPDITSSAQLGAMRRRLYTEMRSIMEKPWVNDFLPWYERQRAGVTEVAGSDPLKQTRVASGIGVYSPQSTPEINYTRVANQMQHQAFTGDPFAKPGTGAQSLNFGTELAGGRRATQGPKTGPFSVSSDPTRFDPDMATNDIWVGRFLGYDGGKFDRTFTGAEHGFVQGEMQRMTAIANREGWGGKHDWHVEELQALPWVEYKGRSLMERNGLTYDEGIRKAMGTTLEALPRNEMVLNNEMVPGAATRHLPGVTSGSTELKTQYTMEPGNFLNAEGRNVFVQSLPNALERPAVPFVGNYTNSAGVLESSPGIAFRPAIEREKGLRPTPLWDALNQPRVPLEPNTKTKTVPVYGTSEPASAGVPRIAPEETFINPTSENAMQVIQTLQGGLNAQEGSVGSSFFAAPKGNMEGVNSVLVNLPAGQVTLDDILAAGQTGAARGMPDAFHLGGQRVLMTNFDPNAPLPDLNTKAMRELASAVPNAEMVPGTRRSIPGAWLTDAWAQPEGTGAVTREMLAAIDKNPAQGRYLLQQFDRNPDVREHIAAQVPRDERYGLLTGTPPRSDLQKLRTDISQQGLERFFDYIRKYGAAGYPALALGLLGGSPEEQPYQ